MGKKKNSLQPFRFRSVAEFLEFVPESEHEIVERLRQIIFDCIPGCVEKLSYNVPYLLPSGPYLLYLACISAMGQCENEWRSTRILQWEHAPG